MTVTLVLGGARSGKSQYAESLCKPPRCYVATALALDTEMQQRVAAHKVQRGSAWATIEAPVDLVAALQDLEARRHVILVDCLTLWLTNLVMQEKEAGTATAELARYLGSTPLDIVIVSNELGLGLVPENGLGRRFRDLHGRMNQQIAAVANSVIFMIAGLPQTIKVPPP